MTAALMWKVTVQSLSGGCDMMSVCSCVLILRARDNYIQHSKSLAAAAEHPAS